MIRWFGSFQWSSLLPLLVLALLLRMFWFANWGSREVSVLSSGVLGESLMPSGEGMQGISWLLGAILVTSIGFVGAYTLYMYRLSLSGTMPALMSVLLGSAGWWWLGYSPMLWGALLSALAAHRIYHVYRNQGQMLPIFDAALLVGIAMLISASFIWMGLCLAVVLAQFIRVKGSDIMALLMGLLLPGTLVWVFQYFVNPSAAIWPIFSVGIGHLPRLAELQLQWPWLSILLLSSGAALGAYNQLSTRRPIPEQRAHRMWYTMLLFGWLALVFGEPLGPWSGIHLLYPLSMLLGIWISERSRKFGNTALILLITAILAGLLIQGFGDSLGLP